MKMLLPAFLYLLNATVAGSPSPGIKQTFPGYRSDKICVELRLNPGLLKDSGKISFQPAEYFLQPKNNVQYKRPANGSVHIEITAGEPAYLNFVNLLRVNKKGYYLTEPGDNVVICSDGDGFVFSGQGAEKYRLQYQLDSLARSIPNSNKKTGLASYYLDSLQEYFAWTNYYRQKIDLAIPLLKSYKGKMSGYAFTAIADGYIHNVMGSLLSKFHSLKEYGLCKRKVPNDVLVQIYDTSYSKAMTEWLGHAINKQEVGLALREHQIQRVYSFDSLRMPDERGIQLMLLSDMMKVYKGQERERLIINSLPKAMIKIGFTSELEKVLAGYYAEPGYPEWKKWMKKQELAARTKALQHRAPDFVLTEASGAPLTNKDLQGKIAILYFQSPGEFRNKEKALAYKKVIERFSDRKDVVFVNVSVDEKSSQWQNDLQVSGFDRYENVINVYTGGQGVENPVIRDYAVTSFPCIWVVDYNGKVVNANPRVDLTPGNAEKLATFIQKRIEYESALRQKEMSYKKDGPYVFHEDRNAISYSIDSTNLVRLVIDKNDHQKLQVQTDLDKTFTVELQSSVVAQPSVYPGAERLLAFSDIEGNFDAFRKLLQVNKIIDENFNWIFGKGHLVFAGDMFDRGMQVTECLWLMYALEEKARKAGGYVHFILGNHEIMNMQGNHRYTNGKYKNNAALMHKTLTQLYSEESELGRWLRTKNIIEKIGGLLFVHGGISPEMNRLALGIEEINMLARPYYGKVIDSSNMDLLTIYDSRYGEKYRISPFWSRGYYNTRTTKGVGKISNEQLDTTLNKFKVHRIVTGHTIVADTISVHYGGRVINTDTKHAKGISEALLIEDRRYYRVDDKGNKVLLFIDDKVKPG